MRNRGLTALLGLGLSFVSAAIAPAAAWAQEGESVPYDPAIDLNLFEYAIGPKTFFTVADATVSAKRQLAVDFLVTYFTHPFTIYNVDDDDDVITGDRVDVVSSAMVGDLSASYGLNDKFQLGVSLPIVFQMAGDGLMPTTAQPTAEGFKATGTGDLRAEVKTRLWRKNAIELAGTVGATLPSSFGSGGGDFIGDDLPSLRGRFIAQWSGMDGKLVLGSNVGLAFRKPRTIYASKIGQQLVWGVAAAYRPTDKFSLVAESFGRTGLEGLDLDASPLEAGGGARVVATKAVAVTIGGSAGVVRGIGSPDFRVFASVGWAPDTRDTDADGIANNKDKCPVAPEDRDSFEDRDGCPDDDNDGDRRDDATDKCPNEAEDFDGYEDDDGCPEADNDGDGFADLEDTCKLDKEDGKDPFPKDGCPWDKRDTDVDSVMDNVDQCPSDPEDADSFEDWDGCPDFDQDKDGVADEDDQCPVCAEDKDGFADEDGCPELDNDSDGFADAADKCPGEAEYVNGVDDFDGCPDEGGAVIVQLDGDRMSMRAPPTFDRKGLNKGGKIIVDQVALTMLQNPLVTKWLVAVSTRKKRDADKRAEWIKDHLASRGVSADRLQIVTSEGPDQVGFVVQERADAPAGGVCPPGMEVVPRQPPADGAAAFVPSSTPASVPAPAAVEPEPVAVVVPPDADGDGVLDADDQCADKAETRNSYQDTDGCPDEVPAPLKKFSGAVKGINFKPGSAEIVRSSNKILDNAAKVLVGFPDLQIEVQGHTDDVGDDAANLELSQRRADAVKAYLEAKGITSDRVIGKGYGETAPAVDPTGLKRSKLRAARSKNRRVEFKLLSAPAPAPTTPPPASGPTNDRLD